jgi:hypothetical protein
VEAEVAIDVGPDLGAARRRLPVLAPAAIAIGEVVVLGAVRVQVEDDRDLAGVDDPGDPTVAAVPVDQGAEDGNRHLGGHVLTAVDATVEQDLRLVLVGPGVVAHRGRPQLAPLERLADAEHASDPGAPIGDRGDLGDHLVVVEIAGILRRERRRGSRQPDEQHRRGECGGRARSETAAGAHRFWSRADRTPKTPRFTTMLPAALGSGGDDRR